MTAPKKPFRQIIGRSPEWLAKQDAKDNKARQTEENESEIETLKAEVKRLQNEVKSLNERVSKLENEMERLR
jgi:peptidoglycan hydrolase CwlO-like protein